MITAISGICGFIVMPQNTFVTISKFSLVLLASFSGLFGVLIGSYMYLIHLISSRSFGIPYLAPIAPTLVRDLKDVLIRAPIWTMEGKPKSIEFSENMNNIKTGDDK